MAEGNWTVEKRLCASCGRLYVSPCESRRDREKCGNWLFRTGQIKVSPQGEMAPDYREPRERLDIPPKRKIRRERL